MEFSHKMANKKIDLRKSSRLWCFICFIFLLIITAQFLHLQVFKYSFFKDKAKKQQERNTVLKADRGRIYDTDLKILAYDDFSYNLFIDPVLFYDNSFTLTKISEIFDIDIKEIEDKIAVRTLVYLLQEGPAEKLIALKENNKIYDGLNVIKAGKRITLTFTPDDEVKKLSEEEIKRIEIICGLTDNEIEKIYDEFIKSKNREDSVILTYDAPIDAMQQIRKTEIKGVTGVLYQGYRVTIDPRHFSGYYTKDRDKAIFNIAMILDKDPERMNNLILGERRYVQLKKNISANEHKEFNKIQRTVFVTDSGAYYNSLPPDKRDEKIDSVAASLYDVINKKGDEIVETVSLAQIRKILLPSAQTGAAFEAYNSKGNRNNLVAYRIDGLINTRNLKGGIVYGLPGVSLEKVPKRMYPYGELASPVLGWVRDFGNHDIRGVFGVEAKLDEVLRGKNGIQKREVTVKNVTIPNLNDKLVLAEHGKDIQLTINTSMQQTAETAMKRAFISSKAIGAQCIVLNSATGEILALVHLPSWNANEPGKNENPYINSTVSLPYEPGSTFKAFTVAMALEEGKIRDGDVITNCKGEMVIGDHTITEAETHESHGNVTPRYLLEQSCNIGSAALALKLGSDKFIEWALKFGFGARTGIELPNESRGYMSRREAERRITLANMGFGQGLSVSIVQLAAAYGVFLNGGTWVAPHIVKAESDGKGKWIPVVPETREVCSEKTSKLMCSYLESVVKNGTGRSAQVPGYRIGGKTGTSQKATPGKGYVDGKYYASFVGVMPLDNSYNNGEHIVILVMLDEPAHEYYGGAIAAPVVGEIARGILPNIVGSKR